MTPTMEKVTKMNRGLLIIISGPSGVGKGTVLSEILNNDQNIYYSVSCTTRDPRPDDIDGVHYHFITKEQFIRNIRDNKMLEYAMYCGNYYGTNAEYVEKYRSIGKDVILEIDTQGAKQIISKCPEAISIFIAPPDVSELKSRLISRATEDEITINKRIERAIFELKNMNDYKYVVVNDVVEKAVKKIRSIICSERILNNKNETIRGVLK